VCVVLPPQVSETSSKVVSDALDAASSAVKPISDTLMKARDSVYASGIGAWRVVTRAAHDLADDDLLGRAASWDGRKSRYGLTAQAVHAAHSPLHAAHSPLHAAHASH
jgi:hypothetical protein